MRPFGAGPSKRGTPLGYDVVMCLGRSSRTYISLCWRRNWRRCIRTKLPSSKLLIGRASGRGCPHRRVPPPPLRWMMGFVAWIVCWVIRSSLDSCQVLVQVSGPCMSVWHKLHVARPKFFLFPFFFPFFFFLPRVHCRFLFSFSPLWAFWCTFLCYHLDVLGYLSYILKDFPTLSHYWPGVRISALLSLDLSFVFCTAFVSSLVSHHCPVFILCSLSSCCDTISSSSSSF